MVGLRQRIVVKTWWMWRAVWNWIGMVGMVGWVSRVWWVDRQELWFEGERRGGGCVVDVARVGSWLQRCEKEGVGTWRWDSWDQWILSVVGGGDE